MGYEGFRAIWDQGLSDEASFGTRLHKKDTDVWRAFGDPDVDAPLFFCRLFQASMLLPELRKFHYDLQLASASCVLWLVASSGVFAWILGYVNVSRHFPKAQSSLWSLAHKKASKSTSNDRHTKNMESTYDVRQENRSCFSTVLECRSQVLCLHSLRGSSTTLEF